MKLKIDKKVPLPGTRPRDIFAKMKVGDSIFFKGADNAKGPRPHAALWDYAKRNKWEVTSRAVPGGVRVWRVK